MEKPVLVIGAAGVDIKASPVASLEMGVANEGHVRHGVGGVARNIAENLARLELPTTLLSAVGADSAGDYLMSYTARAGVDVGHVLRLPDQATGSYVAVLDTAGQVVVGISEYAIVEAISPRYLQQQRRLFAEAAMVVIDANLTPRALESVFLWAKRYRVPVCADPTSQALANKLCKHLPDIAMIAPDAVEAATLCGSDEVPATIDAALASAQCLVGMGVDVAIVTLGEQGLVYADGTSSGQLPAISTAVTDATGVGDALSAAVIFGLLNDMPLDEAVRLGISAAAITLRTRETVVPNLSLDRLYDELVV